MNRRLAIVGLALAAASELILIYALVQDPYAMNVGVALGAPTGIAAAVLAGRLVVTGLATRWIGVAVPALAGLPYLGFAYVLVDVWSPDVMLAYICAPEYTPCAPPIDPFIPVSLGIGAAAILAASALVLLGLFRAGSPTAHVGRLGLLVLSAIPIVSILGLLGFVILSSQKMKEIPA